MNNTRESQKMEQSTMLVVKDTLCPIIRMFLNQLTAVKWHKLETGAVDTETTAMLTEMCVEVIEILAKCLSEMFESKLTKETLSSRSSRSSSSCSGSETSQKSLVVSEEDVHQCLGNMGKLITQTVAKAKGVKYIKYTGSKKMTELMVTAVTETVNSKLSENTSGEDVEEPKTSPGLLKKLANHFKKIFKKCAKKKTKKEKSTSEQIEEAAATSRAEQQEQEEEDVEIPQTPVTSLQEEEKNSRFMLPVKEVQDILQKISSKVSESDIKSYISEKDEDLLLSRSSKDTESLSFEIVEMIMNDCQQDRPGTPERELVITARKRATGRKLSNRIKAFFVHKFARESILKIKAKLRSKSTSPASKEEEMSSTEELIEVVDEVVADMIPEADPDQESAPEEVCLYERLASNISSGKQERAADKLSDVLIDHLIPDGAVRHKSVVEIRSEVDGWMSRMWSWLNQQIQKCKKKKTEEEDIVSIALSQINQAVLSQLEDATPQEEEMEASTCLIPEHEEDQSFTLEHEESPCPSPEELEEDSRSPSPEELEDSWYIKCDCQAALASKVSPAAETGSRRSPTIYQWDRLTCEIIVLELLRRIFKNLPIDPSHSAYKALVAPLTDMLWEDLRGRHIDVDLSIKNMKKICKAVHKDLCSNVGEAHIWRSVLLQSPSVNGFVVETLKKQLLPKKSKGIKGFFSRMFKPFTSLFTRS
ncbi:uncharacterized protein LOC117808509 [Notolabrus celidotus]|uniref:uncharacterized protein LOC117808509 n=1 Tax=Notolabrus celidotus TaxID=1203425 RepID=UPI0014905CD4|nr:uncharacterized protein LOC117808509 [Notolabrus celidotus]